MPNTPTTQDYEGLLSHRFWLSVILEMLEGIDLPKTTKVGWAMSIIGASSAERAEHIDSLEEK